MYLLKLLYFTDRYHLRHFGFVATGDKYFAMKNGPVGTATKDIMQGKMPSFANSAELSLINDVKQMSEYDIAINEQKDDELSESFKQSLDFAVRTYGKYTQFQLSDITHDYPEWKRHEREISYGGQSEMLFIDFFDNPKSLSKSKSCGIKEDPFKDDSKFLQVLKEDFSE
ncbi:MAG: SocA family protein [Endomicrobium sp.]|jgi:uncharacterized phage-associated protein|nr:SocA family protein [Endomicrobium sp.]